jgi:magnesium-protoporphyrin O-methyltransferase
MRSKRVSCCRQCQGLESLFDQKTAAKELKAYRQKGPSKTTRILIDALKAEGVEGRTLLDIGGGIGAIQHELFKAGASQTIGVDASTAYVEAARSEAERQGHADRASYHHGNFVDLAPQIEPVDIVTLDRVICCYPDMPALVGLSSERAARLYGLVYPRDTWWLKIGHRLINFGAWLTRQKFRFFVHPSTAVEALLLHNGLKRRFYHKTFLWQIAIYARS